MKYPKIIFEAIPIGNNVETIKWAYFENDKSLDVHKYTLEYFPELKELEDKSRKEINNKIEEVVINEYKKYEERIKREVDRYNKIWDKYNDKYFEVLSEYLNTNFREDLEVIKAYVGLLPIFPRYLDSCSFAIDIGVKKEDIISTCAHETCHFMWFNKWKELYPECPRKEYDCPYIPWQYSEMVIDPILNSKEIQEVINVECPSYDSFYEIKDKDTYVMDKLKEIYNTNDTIENKMKKGYDYIKSLFLVNDK